MRCYIVLQERKKERGILIINQSKNSSHREGACTVLSQNNYRNHSNSVESELNLHTIINKNVRTIRGECKISKDSAHVTR